MPSAVLLLPKSGYRNEDFLAAAARLGIEVIAASDACHQLADHWRSTAVTVKAHDPREAASELVAAVASRRPQAVIGVDDRTALIAAIASERLGLPHNPPSAVAAARNKALSRAALAAAGVPVPRFLEVPLSAEIPDGVSYPCVAKPLSLSGSRGVIRADTPSELQAALQRISALLRSPDVAQRREGDSSRLLIEEFIPGPEIAIEGLLLRGELRVLAIFDKPDPLDGPYFEETLYVTPSRHPSALLSSAVSMVSRGCRALGLSEGPIHAELRLSPAGPRVLEIAARSIGGLCGRALRFGVGVTLEELVLRHALGLSNDPPPREQSAAGVVMLPIPAQGILEDVHGVEEARLVPLIEDVSITARLREELIPLPEGASYFGFAFARGPDPASVESALRRAQSLITASISPKLPLA